MSSVFKLGTKLGTHTIFKLLLPVLPRSLGALPGWLFLPVILKRNKNSLSFGIFPLFFGWISLLFVEKLFVATQPFDGAF